MAAAPEEGYTVTAYRNVPGGITLAKPATVRFAGVWTGGIAGYTEVAATAA